MKRQDTQAAGAFGAEDRIVDRRKEEMAVNWKYVKHLDDPNAVREYLKQHHIVLPEGLVEILERYNGGRPDSTDTVTEQGRHYLFKALLSYNKTDRETIFMVYPGEFKNTSLYPVGTDAAGNIVCFDTRSQKYVLYNHETQNTEIMMKMPF